jgi:hypothetical protein
VEHQVGRVYLAELTRLDDLAHPCDRAQVAVGEIDAEQPIGGAGRLDRGRALGRGATQRLLAEHGQPALECLHGLLHVQGARRRDDNTVQAQTAVK